MQSHPGSTASNRSMSIFFSGSAHEAIEQCKREQKLLLVFLHGLCDGESIRADAAVHHALQSHNSILALRLYDDLSNSDPLAHEDAKYFREIFPSIKSLPFLMILNPDGDPVAQLEGCEVADRVEDSLWEASNNQQPKEDVNMSQSFSPSFKESPSPSFAENPLPAKSVDSNHSSSFKSNLAANQSPAKSLDSNHSSSFKTNFPAFPAFPKMPGMPSRGSHTPPMSPIAISSASSSSSGSSIGQSVAAGPQTFQSNGSSPLGSKPSTPSFTAASFGNTGGAMVPLPFSPPQLLGQSSTLITNFPRAEAIGMAEAISKASAQAAAAAAGDAFHRSQQPEQAASILQSPSNNSLRGMESQIPSPLSSPQASVTQNFHAPTHLPRDSASPVSHPLSQDGSQDRESQLHDSQSLGAFESTVDPADSLSQQMSVFKEPQEDKPLEREVESHASPAQQPLTEDQLRQREDLSQSRVEGYIEHQPAPEDSVRDKPEHSLSPTSSAPAVVDGRKQPERQAEDNEAAHLADWRAFQASKRAGSDGPMHSDLRGAAKTHDWDARDKAPAIDSPREKSLMPTDAHHTHADWASSQPILEAFLSDSAPQAPSTPPLKLRPSANTRPTDILEKYRRSRSTSPTARVGPDSPRGAQKKLQFDANSGPFFGSQKLSYRSSQDSLSGSPRVSQLQNALEDEHSARGYTTDSSSPKSQATLANGVIGTDQEPDSAAQLLLDLTSMNGALRNPRTQAHRDSFGSQNEPSASNRTNFQGSSQPDPPHSAFEAAAKRYYDKRVGEKAHTRDPLSFRDLPDSDHSHSEIDAGSRHEEDRITEARRKSLGNDAAPLGSPKAEAAKRIFTSGGTDADTKPQKQRQRSPRRSNSLRRKQAQRDQNSQGPDVAPFKGFDTASHRHTSPITSPRAARQLAELPHFEMFKVSDSKYEDMKPLSQQRAEKEQREEKMESPEKKVRLQQMDITPLPDREHVDPQTKVPHGRAAAGRAGMVSLAVGNMQVYMGALLVIVLGFLSGMFSLGAKQIVQVSPTVKDAIVQPFQLIGTQAHVDQRLARKDQLNGEKHIERRRTT